MSGAEHEDRHRDPDDTQGAGRIVGDRVAPQRPRMPRVTPVSVATMIAQNPMVSE
jgi:hypothetical protein